MRKQSGFISISVKNWSCNTSKLPKRRPALALFISNTSYWYLIQHYYHLGRLEKIWYFAHTVRAFPIGLRATPNLDFRKFQVPQQFTYCICCLKVHCGIWWTFFPPRHVLTPSFMLKDCVHVWNRAADTSLWNFPSMENYWNVLTPIGYYNVVSSGVVSIKGS